LTGEESAAVRLPDEAGNLIPDGPQVALTREKFAALVDPLIKRLARPLAKAIRDARAVPEDFDECILVGGATRMLAVREYVARFFSREPLCTLNPDEVVAQGAAVQAALISADAAVEDLVVTDVCPFTLGVEVVKEFGPRMEEGYYLPIIHRNTTIPVSREETVSTIHPNQRQVTVRVYQGEAHRVKDNLPLGTLEVSGIPPGPSGQTVQIRFTYDMNGILEVEAVVAASGQ
jgi:molecular chaperone HscC